MKLLYCLKCVTPGRYYVGYTEVWRWEERHREHTSNLGALWTRIHGVEKVMWKRLVPDKDARRLEDEECALLCCKYGINGCRGGLFNIRSDVSGIPNWIVRPYFERAEEILEATRRVNTVPSSYSE